MLFFSGKQYRNHYNVPEQTQLIHVLWEVLHGFLLLNCFCTTWGRAPMCAAAKYTENRGIENCKNSGNVHSGKGLLRLPGFPTKTWNFLNRYSFYNLFTYTWFVPYSLCSLQNSLISSLINFQQGVVTWRKKTQKNICAHMQTPIHTYTLEPMQWLKHIQIIVLTNQVTTVHNVKLVLFTSWWGNLCSWGGKVFSCLQKNRFWNNQDLTQEQFFSSWDLCSLSLQKSPAASPTQSVACYPVWFWSGVFLFLCLCCEVFVVLICFVV